MKSRIWASMVMVWLVGLLCLPSAQAREWVEKDGERYHAEYITVEDSVDGRVVTLEKFNGSRIVKPLSMFTPADQSYVRDVDSGRLTPEPFGRKWTSQSGKKIRAEFKELNGDKVVLETEGGTRITIPLSGLSPDDQSRISQGGPVGGGTPTAGTEDEFSEFDDLFSDSGTPAAPPRTDEEIDMTFETGTPPADLEKTVWGDRLEAKQKMVDFLRSKKLILLVVFCLGVVTMGVGGLAFLITAFKEGGVAWGLGVLCSMMLPVGTVILVVIASRFDAISTALEIVAVLGSLFFGSMFPAIYLLKYWQYSKGAFLVWFLGFLLSGSAVAVPVIYGIYLFSGSK